MTKMGRPGEDRAKRGRVRGQVKPDIKRRAEELVRKDFRLKSVSRMMEAAMGYFMAHYDRASGNIDENGWPIVPCDHKAEERKRASSHP
jgi:hypothetical protein